MLWLNGRDRMLVDELRQPVALEEHAEQVEGDDLALEHDAVDEEHGDGLARAADGAEEHFLEEHRLAAVELLGEAALDLLDVHWVRGHDRRDGVLVDELGL